MFQEMLKKLQMCVRDEQWAEVERLSRESLAARKFFVPHLFLIQSLIVQGRFDEADLEFEDLISYKFNLADRLGGFQHVADRYQTRLRKNFVLSTMGDGITFEQVSFAPLSAVRRWSVAGQIKSKEAFEAQAASIFDATLGDAASGAVKVPLTSCVTFGSCFAANLAKKFNEKGIRTKCLLIEESVNSTLANKLLLEVAANKGDDHEHRQMLKVFGCEFFDEVRAALSACSHVVLTVGVAPSFFDKKTNAFVFAGRYGDLLRGGDIIMRTTSVEENKTNLRSIISLLQLLAPQAMLFVTVSPVPLAATAEMPSVVVADCVSKSTLRSAVHEVLSEHGGAIYFPAFEIVRWLSGHSSLNIFGEDDGNSRHVSSWVVDFIVKEFDTRFVDR